MGACGRAPSSRSGAGCAGVPAGVPAAAAAGRAGFFAAGAAKGGFLANNNSTASGSRLAPAVSGQLHSTECLSCEASGVPTAQQRLRLATFNANCNCIFCNAIEHFCSNSHMFYEYLILYFLHSPIDLTGKGNRPPFVYLPLSLSLNLSNNP